MKNGVFLLFVLTTVIFFQMNPVYGLNPTTDEAINYIDSRLAKSNVLNIGPDGLVRLKTPDEVIQFNLKNVAFHYINKDNNFRIQVMGDFAIQHYEGNEVGEITHRFTLSCKSKTAALEVLDAFKQLRTNFLLKDNSLKYLEANLNVTDPTLKYTTLSEIFYYINDNLVLSSVLGIDQNGVLKINGPSFIYKINLKKADFAYTEGSGYPTLRIYGDWCMQVYRKDREEIKVARESYLCSSKEAAYEIIKALYYLKNTFTGIDNASISTLKNVTGAKTQNYSTIQEAIDYINDRLVISILMSVDDNGLVSINAKTDIFRFYIKDCDFQEASEKHTFWGVIKSIFSSHDDATTAIEVSNDDGIKRYRAGILDDTLDEQTFLCQTTTGVTEVIKAFKFIKNKLKK